MRLRRLLLAGVSVTTLLAGTSFVAPAYAADGDTGDTGDYIGMAPPERDVPFVPDANEIAQSALFDLYTAKLAAVEKGAATARLDVKIRDAQALVVRLSGFPISEIAPEPQVIADIARARAAGASPTEAASRSAVVKLGVNHVGQKENNWCGPGTGYMILKYKGKTSKNGRSLSQKALSEDAYMGTGTGSTNWGEKDMIRGLNNWGSLGYAQYESPSSSRLRSIVLGKTNAGRPLAYGTAEHAGGKHYNNHPGGMSIYHWITGYGYAESGDRVLYLDPATTVWPYQQPKVKKANSMPTSSMASYISPFGVAG